MDYNFILFDVESEYYRIARYEMEQLPNVRIRDRHLLSGGKWKKKLFHLHTSGVLNRYITIPLQSLWNKAYIGNLDFKNDKPICFIFTAAVRNLPYQMKLFSYLRKKYPGCKLVFLIRDLLSVTRRLVPCFDLEEAKRIYDAIYTINKNEAEKYGLRSIHSFCSRYPVETSPQDPKSDVIFIGVVKDRLNTVKRAYEKFTVAGLVCDFLLVSREPIPDLPEGLRVQEKGIPYSEMLRRTVNSRCVLDVTQKASDGLTSRGLEALCYNKKLLSDNVRLKDTKYYDPRFMKIYSDIDEIDPEFIREPVEVDYHYDGDFSPVRGLELIERELKEMESERKA